MGKASRTKQMKNKKPTKKAAPRIDPHKQKATVAQFVQLAQESQKAYQDLANHVNRVLGELWHNQKELIDGLGAAEFNLRAHQKVINAAMIELEQLHGANPTFAPEVKMTNIPQDQAPDIRRIDWEYYHAQVDEELKAIQEAEKAAAEAQAKAETTGEPADPKALGTLADAPPAVVEAKEEVAGTFPDGATVFGG